MGKKWYRKYRNWVALGLFKVVYLFASVAPLWVGRPIVGTLSLCLLPMLRREHQRTTAHLTLHFPALSPWARFWLRGRNYFNLGVSIFDSLRLPLLSLRKFNRLVTIENQALLDAAANAGRGAVALSGHLSAFELQTQIVQRSGYKAFTVGAKLFSSSMEEEFRQLRSRNGVEYLSRDGALRGIIKNLKAGGLFGVLIDQDTTADGVFAPFLGREAFTPVTMIKLALKYKIPLLYLATVRENGQYRMVLKEPSKAALESDAPAVEIAAEFNRFYSSHIEAHPEQWVWMHRRYRRTPEMCPDSPRYTQERE